ncbi:MAG: GTPase, partial [Ostreibacterium sp.]
VIGAVIALFLALFFFVQFVGFLFDIQQKYANSPLWLIALYIIGVAVISLIGIWLIYKLSRFGSTPKRVIVEKPREVIDDDTFNKKINILRKKGADTVNIEADWKNLLSIRAKEVVTIALFGEINTGKSSLIQMLTGNVTDISAQGGQTQIITNYPFMYNERRYELIDMPGLYEVGDTAVSESLVHDKAIKSHLVVWVMDKELTQSAYEYYQMLRHFDKPIIIAINKADYYSIIEQTQIAERVLQQLKTTIPVVWVSAISTKMVERHYDDGSIKSQKIPIKGNVNELIEVVESITFDRLTLDNQLNNSYFQSLEKDMDVSLSLARQAKAEIIIKSYSQKAIFGGMAAVGPGTDVLLQGYLGMGMAKALCSLYEIDVKSVDLEGTLTMLNDKMKKELAVILALLGNVCKAFPGVGTIAGGIMHAVAYGLIFESVGNAITSCLEKYHGIDQRQLANELEGQIHEHLETRAIRLAKAVIFKQ